MSYNVQYMASKNYVFFYDIDLTDQERVEAVEKANRTIVGRPSEEDVFWTLDQVADVIKKEDPDIVMLQEINGGDDSRTHYIDHTIELLDRLPDEHFPCRSEAPYWKAEFVLHPEILGPVNMKLLTLSKYRITKSVRHQLPRKPRNFLVAPFHFQRALLESHIATDNDDTVAMINTHYDAWGAGTSIMSRQIAKTAELLGSLDSEGVPWVFGGYDETPQISPLYDKYRGIPALHHLTSTEPQAWYTHFPNDPTVTEPDRTIDYQFYSDQWSLDNAYVLQKETLDISDHLPVVGIYAFPRVSP
jgi:endonuclease/exonuclease/phosphatase family metal-dependent hydrolase